MMRFKPTTGAKTLKTVGVCLLTIGLLYSADVPARAATPDTPDQLVNRVLSLILSGSVDRIVPLVHEPDSYSGEDVYEDRRKLAHHLEFMFREFGRASSPRKALLTRYYRLEVAGGDVRYWQSLPNLGIQFSETYLVNFERFGPGVITLTLTRVSGVYALRSVAFGLETNRRGSRGKMFRVSKALMKQMRPEMNEADIDAAVGAGLDVAEGR